MPDMSKPGAHFQDLLETVRFKKLDLRQKANDLLTQAQVYETIEYDLRNVIDKEAKLVSVGKTRE
jgi:hypothetical protein